YRAVPGPAVRQADHLVHRRRVVAGLRSRAMDRLLSTVDPTADRFVANAEHHRALAAELHERTAAAALGGPPRARERHLARGKLLPRDRVEALLDPGTPFLELSPLAM